jgi:teichuronic acid biosynthesis glycosyltransferase TuaG
MINNLVSIITPLYNSEQFISKTIESVRAQTYTNWEMIIVDDCSTDNSKKIVEEFCKIEPRIKYYNTEFPSGSPTKPRNIAIEKAQGRFIAFLDSDDLWEPEKLKSQLELFNDEKVAIVFSNYEKINERGFSNNRIITAPLLVDYKKLLLGNVIACCTCVYDTYKVRKKYFFKQGHEDYALWLEILRNGYIAKNSGFISAKYRVRDSSVSSNKLKTIRWVYTIFRNNENLSIMESIFFTSITLSKSFFKYLK